ncbi:hypothetical protein [Lampropedia aestuarii]|uniref:hypothetical protein n=1 Tax=Lampropedia aestuarii TaxID=2562762 RepID=UPI002468E023|nr:hypothetical protein [Lampropedia aestuarii]MDH5858812.1 hypothetical protein [Lampropedia aestuarii]
MALYELSAGDFKAIAPTTFPAIGTLERKHLQTALRDSISAITPGTDTMVLAEEFGDWEDAKRRIDLLCLDSDRNLVVVELKRDDAGHMELQSLRYAAMISTMRFDQAVNAHREYLERRGKDGGNAESDIRAFLGADEEGALEFDNRVRIVLAASEFSQEVTTTVLWLSSVGGIDIRCVQMQPYQVADRTVVDIEQIIPLPQAAEYQIAIREKARAVAASGENSRDYTRYDLIVEGKSPLLKLPKRWLIFHVVQEAFAQGVDLEEIENAIQLRTIFVKAQTPLDQPPTFNVCFPGKSAARFFSEIDQLFQKGSAVYALSNQWGLETSETVNLILKTLPNPIVTYHPSK